MNNPGTQILSVSDLSRMLVRADVDEADVVEMKIGQAAKIKVDAMPDTSFPGTVAEIGNTAQALAHLDGRGQTNFEVKVVFDHDVPQIRPGMTADVEIETATHARTTGGADPGGGRALRARARARRAAKSRRSRGATTPWPRIEDTVGHRDKEITGVFAVRGGVARFVPVRTGIASETMIEIFGDSLKADEFIVAGPY